MGGINQLTDFLEAKIIDHLFRTATFAKPSNLYIGFFTGAPTDAAGGTEASGGGYARITIAPGDTNFTAPAVVGGKTVTSNSVNLTSPNAPSGNWGTLTHYGVFDALTGGNLLIWDALSAPQTVLSGDPTPYWPVGSFQFAMDYGSDYLEAALLNHIFRTATFAKPTGLYYSLITANVADDGTGAAEPAIGTGGYARVNLAPLDANYAAPVSGNGVTSNIPAVTFGAPTTAWGTMVGMSIRDAATGGNLIAHSAFPTIKSVNAGNAPPSIPAGGFTWTVN